jgi:hypothetical protein
LYTGAMSAAKENQDELEQKICNDGSVDSAKQHVVPNLEDSKPQQKPVAVNNSAPLSRIPWIPIQTTAKYSLEGTKFYKDVMTLTPPDSDEKKDWGKHNAKNYRVMNEVIPFYLPIRYSFSLIYEFPS